MQRWGVGWGGSYPDLTQTPRFQLLDGFEGFEKASLYFPEEKNEAAENRGLSELTQQVSGGEKVHLEALNLRQFVQRLESPDACSKVNCSRGPSVLAPQRPQPLLSKPIEKSKRKSKWRMNF